MFLMGSFWFATGLAAALGVIPVIVHLLHRQQVTPITWGAMQFLTETPLKVKRRRRVDNWLLMLIRMAILMLIVFLLCRPVIQDARLVGYTPVDVAIVIDHSLTMGQRTAAAGPAANIPMGANPSAGTLFEEALNAAQSLAKMLPSSSTISIVLAEHTPNVKTPTPIRMGISEIDSNGDPRGEWGRILTLLRQMPAGMTRANIPDAIRVARGLLAQSYNTRKMILVLSDHQATNWYPGSDAQWKAASATNGPSDPSAVGRIPVYSYPLTAALSPNAANIAVSSIKISPAYLGVHRTSAILATVKNSGGADVSNVPIELLVDGKLITTQTLASLPHGASETLHFDHDFPEPGAHWIQVHAQILDSLEADNTATAAVNVNSKLPVLIVDGQLTAAGGFPDAYKLAAAMEPLDPDVDAAPLIEPHIISVAQIGASRSAAGSTRLEDYPVVVLNDVPRLPRETLDRLLDHVQRGNGVWIILGPRTEADFLTNVLGQSSLFPLTSAKIVEAPMQPGTAPGQRPIPVPISLDIRVPSNPAVAAIADTDQNALAGVSMRKWWSLVPASPEIQSIISTTTALDDAAAPATDPAASEPAATGLAPAAAPPRADFSDSTNPFMLELVHGKLGGRVIVWSSPVSSIEWNSLPWVPPFTPLVNETLFHLASGRTISQPRQLEVGSSLYWTGPVDTPIESATVEPPDGNIHELHPQAHGDSYFLEDSDTFVPGLYTLRFSARPINGAKAPPPVYYSVNIDPQELNTTPLSPSDIDWLKSQGHIQGVLTAETLPTAIDAQPGGSEVWKWLGLLLLAFLLMEILLTRNLVRQQSGSTLETAGLANAIPASAIAPLQEGAAP